MKLVQSSLWLLYKLSRRHQGLCSNYCSKHVRQQMEGGLLPWAHVNVYSPALCWRRFVNDLLDGGCRELADDRMPWRQSSCFCSISMSASRHHTSCCTSDVLQAHDAQGQECVGLVLVFCGEQRSLHKCISQYYSMVRLHRYALGPAGGADNVQWCEKQDNT